jgi:uncharacterized OB-fold protein
VTRPRPLPIVTPLNAPFYRAAAEGKLLLQYCLDCEHAIYYPRYACPFCMSDRLEWRHASGRGSIYSFALVFRPQHDYFADRIPVALAAIEVDEGPLMIADVIGEDRTDASIGAAVMATFETIRDDLGLVHFRLVQD